VAGEAQRQEIKGGPTMKLAIRTLLLVINLASVIAYAQQNTPPKYPTCPTPGHTCDQNLGQDTHNANTQYGCIKWCSDLPLKITPDPIQACVGQTIQINVRVDGAMDTQGNAIDKNNGRPGDVTGSVNWGDGTPESGVTVQPGPVPFNQNVTHLYQTAGTYYPSGTVAQQFSYTGDGSCGYRCRSQQSDVAIVYLANSPECATGVFKPSAASERRKAAEIKKLSAMSSKSSPK
jgi:hypothetical protein